MYITLLCGECDNADCCVARAYIPEDSQEGCTREVTEEQQERIQYYMNEVLPFVHMGSSPQAAQSQLEEIASFLDTIYLCPLGTRLDSRGKAIAQPKNAAN